MQLLSALILVHCFLLGANTSITNFIHKRTDDDQEEGFSLAKLDCALNGRTNTRKKIIPYSFIVNAVEWKYSTELIRRWQIDEIDQRSFCSPNSEIQRRKLLIYSDKILHENTNDQLHKDKQRNTIKKVTKSIESQDEFWDDWSSWSSCSATCGNGHQVRWRHCSRESCPKGFKKAQIKTCHLKKCESKNILRWLGIKSK